MDYTHLHIELSNNINLKFRLLDTPLTHLWLERMTLRNFYNLDHPDRFYGFDSELIESSRAINTINRCIEVINLHEHIIFRSVNDINDQDTLNYLHNIFEKYHGLLNQQNHHYWLRAPLEVKKALAELNLAVHRCESVARGTKPRFVCTWFGLPKTETLPPGLIENFGKLNPSWGSVCINYAEIGKTLEDLTKDNDRYISDDAFKPFRHFSADFVVRFYEDTEDEMSLLIENMKSYYNLHKEFFNSRGYTKFSDPQLLPYRLVVAELDERKPQRELLNEIKNNQLVTKVYLQ